MAIIDLQRRIHEAGRIRIGQQVAGGNGKSRPTKLDTFRLTSPDRARIVNAAKLYGGTPQQWDSPSGKQWEVVTETDSLNVIVPPSDLCFSQFYELWSGGGCQRRCDGVNESISDGPCLCDPDARECAIHTRLSVMLADLPGLGTWRIDTSGYYAAVELQGAVGVIQMAAGRGHMLPAKLRLEQRMVKRGGQTRRFPVPVLDVEISPNELVGNQQRPDVVMVERDTGKIIEQPQRSALTPVPETVPERPVPSVAEQAKALDTPRPRRRTATPVPETGIRPRTVEQAKAAADDDVVTPPQLRKLSILRKEAGYQDSDEGRADWFRHVETTIGRHVGSNKDLTKTEASVLIDIMENDGSPQG